MLPDPIHDSRKAELSPIHRAIDEVVSFLGVDVDIKTVATEKNVGGGEGDPLVPIDEAVIVAEGLHQRGRLFFEGVVIAGLGPENGGLHRALVADTMKATEHLDKQVLHLVDFRDRKVLRHLLGETLQQVTIANHRLLKSVHYVGADQVLGRNHVA